MRIERRKPTGPSLGHRVGVGDVALFVENNQSVLLVG
jgi:hypothetical protein